MNKLCVLCAHNSKQTLASPYTIGATGDRAAFSFLTFPMVKMHTTVDKSGASSWVPLWLDMNLNYCNLTGLFNLQYRYT